MVAIANADANTIQELNAKTHRCNAMQNTMHLKYFEMCNKFLHCLAILLLLPGKLLLYTNFLIFCIYISHYCVHCVWDVGRVKCRQCERWWCKKLWIHITYVKHIKEFKFCLSCLWESHLMCDTLVARSSVPHACLSSSAAEGSSCLLSTILCLCWSAGKRERRIQRELNIKILFDVMFSWDKYHKDFYLFKRIILFRFQHLTPTLFSFVFYCSLLLFIIIFAHKLSSV